MSKWSLFLFGMPHVERDGAPLAVERRKTLALLAYFAVEGRTFGRDTLATLLWPELDQQRARTALRHTLAAIRQVIGEGNLHVEGDSAGICGEIDLRVDVLIFRSLLARVEAHGHPPAQVCDGCLADLTEAAALYCDGFMAGFSLLDSAEFDAWQAFQADALQGKLATVLEKLALANAARGDFAAATLHARRWLALEPLSEAAHRVMMQLHAWMGNRSGALRQYDECTRILAAELGVEPDLETRRLAESIRMAASKSGQVSSDKAAESGVPDALLPDPTPFFGRKEELAQVAKRLDDPACRLLTVLGPGGIGKTRLAIEAARGQVGRFTDGVHFVNLAAVSSAGLLPGAILNVIDARQPASAAPDQLLVSTLRRRQMLLVLDSFEHLLEGTELLAQVLRAAPGVKILVTSRERLNLREEWLYPLSGLQVPPDLAAAGPGAPAGSSAELAAGCAGEPSPVVALERFSATALFLDCMRRVQPDFRYSTAEASQVVRICRLLEGTPLGIELAAAWVRTLQLSEIAGEIERGLSILATTARDVPDRQRSMQACFDHSWGLMPERSRRILSQLSVFRGGFAREAAEAVAGASFADLLALIDASWMRHDSSGRYEMHELAREFCMSKLDEPVSLLDGGSEAGDAVRRRHATYYAALLQHLDSTRGRLGEAARAIAADLGNARAAWQWAITAGEAEVAHWTAQALSTAETLGWLPNALPDLEAAVRQLRARLDLAQRPDLAVLIAFIRTIQGYRLIRLGFYRAAYTCLSDGWSGLAGIDIEEERADYTWFWIRYRLGLVLYYQGRFAESNQLFGQILAYLEGRRGVGPGLRLSDDQLVYRLGNVFNYQMYNSLGLGCFAEAQATIEQSRSSWGRLGEFTKACSLRHLGVVLHARGRYSEAERVLREALNIFPSFNDKNNAAAATHTLGLLEMAAGRPEQAQALFRSSLATARDLGLMYLIVQSLNGLGGTSLALGQPGEAQRLFEESASAFGHPDAGPGIFLATALTGLGRVALATRDPLEAGRYFREALGVPSRAAWETAQAIAGLADLCRQQGDNARAIELLALVEASPGAWHETRRVATLALSELAAVVQPTIMETASARGRARSSESVIAELPALPGAA